MSLHVAASGAGPDLVLLHGWGLHGGVWDGVREALAATFRVHAIDLPGHGHSRATPFGSLDDVCDAVRASMPADATLCGWSLGGLLAQRLAVRDPARVRALALVATTPCFVERAGWPHAMKRATLESFATGLANDLEGTLRTFVALNALGGNAAARTAARGVAAQLAARGAPHPSALAGGLALLLDTDLRREAPAIPQPCLVVHGGRDALAPLAAGRWLAATIPHARLQVHDDAAHLPFLTHREPFVAALRSLHG